MTITITDCNNLVIDSEWFETFWDNYPNNLYRLSLTYSYNGAEPVTVDLDNTNLLNLTPFSHLFTADQGVYAFTITRTEIATENKETDFKCFFNECDLNCELAENLATGCETTHRLITYLRAINDCNKCDCKYANLAYSALVRQTGVTPLNIVSNDCNCN